METGMVGDLWVHGGLALGAGIVILLFPKIFFYLIGGFLIADGVVVFARGGEMLVGVAIVVAGVLIFLSPKFVAWLIALYLLAVAAFVALSGISLLLAIPAMLLALAVLLLQKILPFLIGGFLVLAGGISLAAAFLGAG